LPWVIMGDEREEIHLKATPKFSGRGDDYVLWCEDFKNHMIITDRWYVFEEDPDVVAADFNAYAVDNRKAFAALISSLPASDRAELRLLASNDNSASEGWRILQRRYTMHLQNAQDKVAVRIEKFAQRKGESLHAYLDRAT
jgi:hypothetical protein